MIEENSVPPGDNTHLTDAELSARLAELDAPSTPAERREYHALRELRERRADQRSGSVPVSHIAHMVNNALVPARYHLEKLTEGAADVVSRAEHAKAGVVRILEWVEQLVRRSKLS